MLSQVNEGSSSPDESEHQASKIRTLSRQLVAQRSAPRIVQLELILTESCNLGCTYCFEYGANQHSSMSVATALGAVDFLFEASRNAPHVGITFMGGEPMLRFDLIREVIRYAHAAGVRTGKTVGFSLQTNGLLINEEHAKYFRNVNLRYCLSLDGNPASNDKYRRTHGGSGTFRIIEAKMKMLKKYQHWQGARMTIMPSEAERLSKNIRTLHEDVAINQFIIGFATHVHWEDTQIAHYARGLLAACDYLIEQTVLRRSRRLRINLFELGHVDEAFVSGDDHPWGCGAGSGRLAVGADGVFHGCSKLAWSNGDSQEPTLPLGSVGTGLSRPENRLKLLNHTIDPRTKCHSCAIRRACQGGCHAANVADTGDMYVPADYFCKLMFAQKHACDHARRRMRELGLSSLRCGKDTSDLAPAGGVDNDL